MNIRNKIGILTVFGVLLLGSCSKKELDQPNPNLPGLQSLYTEEGFTRAGLGVYTKFGLEYFWLALTTHNVMGDNTFTSVGNFAWRWANQPTRMILDDGTVLTPPQGGTQGKELKDRNTRAFGNDNVFYNEWLAMYLLNNQANLILSIVDDPNLQLTGNVATKKATFKAWAYWWKGFVYSRIGSLYVSGIISDVVNETNSNFVDRPTMIAAAAANFDKCVAALNEVTDVAVYRTLMERFIPSMTKVGKGGYFTPDEWKRHINTYKARNILVSKRVAEMTTADWNSILTLTENGLRSTDKILTMRTADANAVIAEANAGWSPWRLLTGTWEFVSERWVQDFKPGDARRTRNIVARSTPLVNNSGRGFQYGTRWNLRDVTAGGDYASQTAGAAEIPMGCTYEENALTRAEALIKTGQIQEGLRLIDEVRTYQKAELPAVFGTPMTEDQAYLELRSERRIALFLKNTPFYDARRWGWAVKDGQRTGVVIIGPNGVVSTNGTIVYNYLEYFDVPLNEIDFNAPADGSAPVVFPY